MNNRMRGHNQDYIVIFLAGILLIITFLIAYISLTTTPEQTSTNYPVPTALPTISSTMPLLVSLDNSAESRLANIITNRPKLSPSDTQQKSAMLNTILHGSNSGILFKNNDVQLEYVQSADLFMAEIYTAHIIQAKTETVNWLRNQGISPMGICNLPVVFYLNPVITQELQGQDVIFSPLPNGC